MKDVEKIIHTNDENCAYVNFLYNSEIDVKKLSDEDIKIHQDVCKQFIEKELLK